MLITVQNSAEPQVLLMVLTGAMLMLIGNSLVAGELGKRRQTGEPAGCRHSLSRFC
jgi:hypothetical protein